MMMNELKIRRHVRKILLENETTRRPGRGGYKREIQAAGALAKQNPAELMKRLGVTGTSGENDIEKLNSLLKQATAGSESSKAMIAVFGEPQPRKDRETGLKGIRIPVSVIPPRDARKYLEHTLVGAQAARTALFIDDIQIEILGNDVLLYFASKPYSWGRSKAKTKAKQPADQAAKDESKKPEKKRILGEPDLNPDRDTESNDEPVEASVAVSGPITPLGTGPRYPDKEENRRSPAVVAGSAFGGAKPIKKKNNKN